MSVSLESPSGSSFIGFAAAAAARAAAGAAVAALAALLCWAAVSTFTSSSSVRVAPSVGMRCSRDPEPQLLRIVQATS